MSKHPHYWKISTPAIGEHIIGVCKLCGAVKDFTVLQYGIPGVTEKNNYEDFNMNTLMKSNQPKKPRGRKSKYSRGRVG